MIEYSRYGYYNPTIKYNKKIKEIHREGDKFTRIYKDGSYEDIDGRTAIYDIIGAQYHFLMKHGRLPSLIAEASNPKSLIEDQIKELTIEEAYECLRHLAHGIYNFTNKRCKKAEVARGIGYLACKLYETHRTACTNDFADLMLSFTAVGTCIFQFSRKPLARSLYIGMYEAWDYLKNIHTYMYTRKDGWHFEGIYDNVLECEDVFDDPIHKWKKYPDNVNSYSIDNLILSYSIAYDIADLDDKGHFLNKELRRDVTGIRYCVAEFLKGISPLFKTRADSVVAKSGEYGNYGIDIRDKYKIKLKDPKTGKLRYDINRAPYLMYTWNIFKVQYYNDNSFSMFKSMQSLARKSIRRLDPDCPIFEDHDRLEAAKDERRSQNVRMIITLAVIAVIIHLAWGFITSTDGLGAAFIFIFGFLALFGFGTRWMPYWYDDFRLNYDDRLHDTGFEYIKYDSASGAYVDTTGDDYWLSHR